MLTHASSLPGIVRLLGCKKSGSLAICPFSTEESIAGQQSHDFMHNKSDRVFQPAEWVMCPLIYVYGIQEDDLYVISS